MGEAILSRGRVQEEGHTILLPGSNQNEALRHCTSPGLECDFTLGPFQAVTQP